MDLISLDRQLFSLINHDLSFSIGDWFFPAITEIHRSPVFILACVVLFSIGLIKNRFKTAQIMLAIALAVSLSDSIAYRGIKQVVERKRPEFSGMQVELRTHSHSGHSFPSNHAANSAAIATVMVFFFPAAATVWIFLAALIAYSRVYVGVHFPSDVLGGACLGIMTGLFGYWVSQRLFRLKSVADFFRARSSSHS